MVPGEKVGNNLVKILNYLRLFKVNVSFKLCSSSIVILNFPT